MYISCAEMTIFLHSLCFRHSLLTFPELFRQFTYISQVFTTIYLLFLCFRNNLHTFPVLYTGLGIRSSVSEQIARFLPKNEQMSDSLKKMSDSLIRSFLVSDLSNLLTIAHFL